MITKFLNEAYKMQSTKSKAINEGFTSRIFNSMANDEVFKRFVKVLLAQDYDVSRITDSMIEVFTNMRAAYRVKDKDAPARYFKIWIAPDGLIAYVTAGNSMFDDAFITDTKKRSPNLVGRSKYTEPFLKVNNTVDFTKCYILDRERLPKIADIKDARKKAKQDAIAMLTNRDIRTLNLKRYAEAIKKSGFSDGSELELVYNVAKFIKPALKDSNVIELIFKDEYLMDSIENYCKVVDAYLQTLQNAAEPNSWYYGENADKVIDRARQKAMDALDEVKKRAVPFKTEYSEIIAFYSSKDFTDALAYVKKLGDAETDEYKQKRIREFEKIAPQVKDALIYADKNFLPNLNKLASAGDLMSLEHFSKLMRAIRREDNMESWIRYISDFATAWKDRKNVTQEEFDKEIVSIVVRIVNYTSPKVIKILKYYIDLIAKI